MSLGLNMNIKTESMDTSGLNYDSTEFRENNPYSPEMVPSHTGSKPYANRCKRRILFSTGPKPQYQSETQVDKYDNVASPVQPASVVRRNERERNRVRMVNNGFATLRQHVPNGVKNKKMSKVETLKSAVDYIKQLQELLMQSDAAIVKTEVDREDSEDFQQENRASSYVASIYNNQPTIKRSCTTEQNDFDKVYNNNCYENYVADNGNLNQHSGYNNNGHLSFYSSNGGSPSLSWPSSDASSPGSQEHNDENILAFSSWFS